MTKMSRNMRRGEAIRKNRFKMLSWDPSRLFHEAYSSKYYEGILHEEDRRLTADYERLQCSEQPWAINNLERVRRDTQACSSRAHVYHEYATIILMHRAKMSVEERCRIDLEARNSAPKRLPSNP